MTNNDSALILVVDDDDLTRMHLCYLMKQAGYQVAEASNGDEALTIYNHRQPDIVLLDAMMPVMDGFTCCAKLQTLSVAKSTPVLMITALYDQESVEQAFAVGATDFINKPIQWSVLRQRVDRLLAANRTMQVLRQQTEQAQLREAQLRMALEAAQMGIWNWDLQTNKITCSDTLEALYGVKEGTFNGNCAAFTNCIHPQERDLVKQASQQAVQKGEDYDIEFRVVLPDGSIRWLASKGVVFYDASGMAVRISGVDIDITKHKQAEETLEVYAKQQAILAEMSQMALSGTDLTTLMNLCVIHVAQCLKVEYSKVLELLSDGNALLLRTGVGWQSGLVGQATVSSGINSQAGYTLLSRKPVIVDDLRTEMRFNGPQLLHDHQVVSGISVVIDSKEHPFGVLGAHTTKQRTFTKDEVYFLQAVANILATAIERQRVEEALKKSEERASLAVRGNNDGIWDWNLKTDEVFFSARWKEMLGYEVYEIDNHLDEWIKRIHPDDLTTVRQAIADHFAKTTPFYISEHRVRCKNDTYKWILARGQAVWDQDGHAIRMTSSHTDITERKLAHAELERQNMRSQLFADITLKIRKSLQIDKILQTSVTEVQKLLHADRVLILRLKSDYSFMVMQEAVVPGLPIFVGQLIKDPCFGEDYIQQYRQGRISTINDIEQANIQPCHLELLRQFGVKANLVVPIFWKNQLWGLLIAHQCAHPRQWTNWEIELLRQLADQIGIALAQSFILEKETRQRQELARSNEELQQFAFIASHDLKEPLRKIKTFSERLQTTCGESLNEQGHDYLERMHNAALRMQNLIEDLLTLSRVTTRKQPFVLVNLAQIVQEVLSDLEVSIQQSGGCIEVGKLPIIKADPLQMHQLLQNLIGNALKFHCPHTPPIVKIYSQFLNSQSDQISVDSETCQIVVEDNGIGFEEKYIDRIFNIFQRLHSRKEYEGTGMGLAICRKIVERHHGKITAQSKPGKGAKFIVILAVDSQS
ncbi:PAS domain-containing protein [Halotia branconii]|uniref:histidine kinase n=1 Tax=Halotia branconii CENA392 TaxID=1539056 RepID=A0AAJ6P7E2_9CYAN|nr:PAS domain-containing protein [Halotia branconii]WGV23531.1 PAS domain-containing protein [Halotia branconii CENA392]